MRALLLLALTSCARAAPSAVGAPDAGPRVVVEGVIAVLGLELSVQMPERVKDLASMPVKLELHNLSNTAMTVLPHAGRIRFVASPPSVAEYTPYPGPPRDPYRDARDLAPGATFAIETNVRELSHDGAWRVTPGSVTAIVDFAVRNKEIRYPDLWIGDRSVSRELIVEP